MSTTYYVNPHLSRPRYTDAHTQVQLGQYPVLLPEWYAPISEYDACFNTTPAYEWDATTQGDLSNGVATIAQMIEMHFNKYKFIILVENDVLEIMSVLEQLFRDLQLVANMDADTKRFVEMSTAFYQALVAERTRIHNRHGLPGTFVNTIQGLLGKLLPTR